MKHVIFALLLAIGLAVAGTVALRDGRPVAEADPMAQLRRSYGDFNPFKSVYRFERLDLFRSVSTKVSNDYVDPSRIDPQKMLDESLNFICRAVPEAMFVYEPGDETIRGTVGAASRDIDVGRLANIRDLSRVLEEVAEFLSDEVSEDTDLPKVEYAMINGMLSTLDPHSVFIDPESFEEMSISNEGAFGGLGITIGNREYKGKQRLTILYPLPDTPAWRMKLKKRDRIVRIGAESTVNMRLDEAVNRLRGEPGTDITITIERDEGDETRTFEVTLTREEIKVPSVKAHYLGDAVGGIKLIHFSQNTAEELDRAITEMDRQAREDGFDSLAGLVLDLRDNPGGYLSQAIQVSDKFLDEGVLVSTSAEEHPATRYGSETDLRLVVILDQGSASASEIFAGAIKHLDRGVLLGVESFGKGSVQNLYPFHADESALKLTIDKYYTPGKHSIQSVGITPDIELRPAWIEDDGDAYLYWQDAWMREADLDDHFTGGEREERASLTCLYLDEDNELWNEDTSIRDEPDDMGRWAEEFQVQMARTIITSSQTPRRREMLRESLPAVRQMIDEQSRLLEARMAELGLDWSAGDAGSGTPRARVEMTVGSDDGVLLVGETTPLTLSVTNVGDAPFFRLRAMTESRLLEGREFLFGRVDPGETRSWSIDLSLGLGVASLTDDVTFEFFAEGSPAPDAFVGQLMIEEKPRPRFAYTYQVVDDGSGQSSGNGDGLIQAGESIDLLVTVTNVGEGPTGDFYRDEGDGAAAAVPGDDAAGRDPFLDVGDASPAGLAGHGAPAAGDDAAGEDDGSGDAADEPAGIVYIKNKSGEDLFLTEGSAWFSLDAGETTRVRLHFDVAQNPRSEALDVEINVGDEEFYEYFSDNVSLPITFTVAGEPPVDAIPAHHKTYRTRGPVAVRSGALPDSPRVATADGVVTATGRLGTMVRVDLPWGTSGWIATEDLKGAAGGGAAAAIEPWISRSPPVVLLTSRIGGTAVDSDTVELRGLVRDENRVKDMFVFVNGTKVYYHGPDDRAGGEGDTLEFTVPVDLDEGVNDIEIMARDDEDLLGSMTVGVYRRPSVETAQVPTTPDAG